MKNALIITSSPDFAAAEMLIRQRYNTVTVKKSADGEILSKDFHFDLVFSDEKVDPLSFPSATVILTYECEGAYRIPDLSEKTVSALLSWIEFSDRKTEKMKSEMGTLQKKIEDISIIGRAKRVLMKTLGMTEDEAHKYIEKSAMEMRITKSEIAKRVLATYET